MPIPSGYTADKELHSGANTRIVDAVRTRDGCRVLLKCYQHDSLPEGGSRACREHRALVSARGVGVPAALDLILSDDEHPVLVLKAVAGLALSAWIADELPSIRQLLDIACGAARALRTVHDANLLHLDIQPAHVIADRRSGAIHLIGFGAAQFLGEASRSASAREVTSKDDADSLAFISPEQSGRMGRGVDKRSDLYSLGATLYCFAVGHPPFESRDPLALMHAHLARVPKHPGETREELRGPVSGILMRLLEKEPEARYQDAESLLHDLTQCIEHLEQHGDLTRLELVGGTASVHPVFPAQLIGRKTELSALRERLAAARGGRAEFTWLAGPPGIGKATLVSGLRDDIAELHGHLCHAAFDHSTHKVPYAGLRNAFESLVEKRLCEDDASISAWKSQLESSLGTLSGVMTEWIPNLTAVIGEVDAPPPVGPRESRRRLLYAVGRFLGASATPERPLVIHLTQFESADRGSLWLLEQLLLRGRRNALLVIASIPELPESDTETVLARFESNLRAEDLGTHRIALGPLPDEDIAQWLRVVLDPPATEIEPLAATVSLKSGGNPLVAREFIGTMHQRGCVRFETDRGWTWDLRALQEADASDGAVESLLAKLIQLPEPLLERIQFLSCIDDGFDTIAISARSTDGESAWTSDLYALHELGLLSPCSDGFRFAHAQLRTATRATLSDAERAAIHARIAQVMLAHSTDSAHDEASIEIADHLLTAGGTPDLSAPRISPEAAYTAFRRAGKHALGEASGAAGDAVAYFEAARELWQSGALELSTAEQLELFIDSTEALYHRQESAAALDLLAQLNASQLDSMQRARLEAQRVRVLMQVSNNRALDHALASARDLGLSLPRNPSRLRIRWTVHLTDWVLRGPLDERTFGAPDGSDLRWVQPILILREATPALFLFAPGCLKLYLMHVLRSLAHHGAIRSPAIQLAAFAAMRVEVLGNRRQLVRYIEAVRYWCAARPGTMAAQAEASLLIFARQWLEPRSGLAEPLRGARARLLALGEFQLAHRCTEVRFCCLALTGLPLPEIELELEQLCAEPLSRSVMEILTRTRKSYASLRFEAGDAEQPLDEWGRAPRSKLAAEDASRDPRPAPKQVPVEWSIHHLSVLALLGHFEEIEFELARVDLDLIARTPTIEPDFWWLRGLAAAALVPQSRRRVARRRKRELRRALRELERMSPGHAEWEHMISFLRAERAGLRGRSALAHQHYLEAIRLARSAGCIQRAAFACERCVRILRGAGSQREADRLIEQGVELYEQWGASRKASALARHRSVPHA